MKKLFFAALLAGFAFNTASAQDEEGTKGFAKGDVFMSGSVGFESDSQGDTSLKGFTVAPRAAYFISDNIALGAKLGYTSSKEEDEGFATTQETEVTAIEAGVFGRYYFTPASQFSIFTELGAGYVHSKYEETGDPEIKADGFNVAFAPGVSYFISNNFALEASYGLISYNSDKVDVDGAESRDRFNAGLDLGDINLGLVYKF
ncbi:porin family protein [Bizionia gelidisalsuginis]|uniref:Porin family protein n=2 Tax=Bizionia TaxID=283785 RepID=A0A8H2QEM7_9FLAO|nr:MULTISPECIES: porin family protein [Bizionia]TYB72615.1 porin family protein [Bizionia saleffrena]TYC18144.1 porin family protein [Bizionia gelidisalsuginis]